MSKMTDLHPLDSSAAVIVTSISPPNPALKQIASECLERAVPFIVIGDLSSPSGFALDGCDFYGISRQLQTGFKCAKLLPTRHYSRKNLGYLLAVRNGSRLIIETDDDNFPRQDFWRSRQRSCLAPALSAGGWVNVYSYFTDSQIWPRGLPLDEVRRQLPDFESLPTLEVNCPIQQGLADENPDVDAVFRLLFPLSLSFRRDRRVALAPGTWSPFNSQNTAWFPEAYPLLYLPSYCSFRMTDIWRSFVAQRIAWTNGWSLLFTEPDVYQERNEHNLMKDFADEVSGYLHNRKIGETLDSLPLLPGPQNIGGNLLLCYEALIGLRLVDAQEIALLEAWLDDLKALGAG